MVLLRNGPHVLEVESARLRYERGVHWTSCDSSRPRFRQLAGRRVGRWHPDAAGDGQSRVLLVYDRSIFHRLTYDSRPIMPPDPAHIDASYLFRIRCKGFDRPTALRGLEASADGYPDGSPNALRFSQSPCRRRRLSRASRLFAASRSIRSSALPSSPWLKYSASRLMVGRRKRSTTRISRPSRSLILP